MIAETSQRITGTATPTASLLSFSAVSGDRDFVLITNCSKTLDLLVGFSSDTTALIYDFCIKPQQTLTIELGVLIPVYVASESTVTYSARQVKN